MGGVTEAREAYLDDFRRLEGALAGSDRPWLAESRRRAIDRFATVGFPGAKNEDWKYTSVGPLLRTRYRQAFEQPRRAYQSVRAAVSAVAGIAAGDPLAVFVDGEFCGELSRLPAGRGVRVESLRACLCSNDEWVSEQLGTQLDPGVHGFVALNSAFATDGLVLRIAAGTVLERPVHVVFYAAEGEAPVVVHPRSLIVVEQGGCARVVEHWLGAAGADYLTNAATEVWLEAGASLEHVKVQLENEAAHHVHRMQIRQERDSRFRSFAVGMGAAVSRTEITSVLAGEGADCLLFGLYLGAGRRHVDHHTTIDHVAAHTSSREIYKGILDDSSRGVFTGKVIVRPDAQRISAEQSNKNLLLAEGASVETRPQLEIYADDVKCTHGAAIGRLDEDALFYLRQRGIDLGHARALLTYAFGSEVLEKLSDGALRRELERMVLRRIHHDGSTGSRGDTGDGSDASASGALDLEEVVS